MVRRWWLILFFLLFGDGERISDKLNLGVVREELSSFLLPRRGRGVAEDHGQQQPTLDTRENSEEEAGTFPQTCFGGAMELRGTYQVPEAVIISEPCNVTGHGAKVHLRATIRFQGSVHFFGQLEIEAGDQILLDGPCMVIDGSFVLHPGANISFEDCNNVRTTGPGADGGALQIHGDAELSGGRLAAAGCSAGSKANATSSRGGSIYVAGSFTHRDGTTEISDCRAVRGGAIYAGSVDMLGGGLSVYLSSSSQKGGAIFTEKLAVFGGKLTIVEAVSSRSAGAIRASAVNMSSGMVLINGSSSEDDGGAIDTNVLGMSGGHLTIQLATARKGGGAISSLNMDMLGGHLAIEQAYAYQSGGGMKILEDFNMIGGRITINKGSAGVQGGGIFGKKITIRSGHLQIQRCFAERSGGGISASKGFRMMGGNITISETRALKNGGGIMVDCLNMTGGSIGVNGTTAQGSGGAMSFGKRLYMLGGNLTVNNSQSAENGGALQGRRAELLGGAVTLNGTSCHRSGGAVRFTDMKVSGTSLAISNSTAAEAGGGFSVVFMEMISGNITIDESRAEDNGGGVFAHSLRFLGGRVSLTSCTARHHGGALMAVSFKHHRAALLHIQDAAADRGGGAYLVKRAAIQAESFHLSNCSARSFGGCVYARDDLEFHGQLSLRRCNVDGSGGGILTRKSITAEQITCDDCTAAIGAVLQTMSGASELGRIEIRSYTRAALTAAIVGGPDAKLKVQTLGCLQAPGCGVQARRAEVAQLACQRGEGRQILANDEGIQCQSCPAGQTRLVMLPEAQCSTCPDFNNAIVCTATELVLPSGYMVIFNRSSAANLTAWVHCPSEAACPGGHFRAGNELGEPAQEVKPMCQPGHEGAGCTHCAAGYAQSDSNVLLCVECSRSRREAWLYIAFYLMKNLALFISAVISVSGATSRRMTSATLLNQLMSFAAVAGIAMSGAMQTQTFKTDLVSSVKELFRYLSLPVSIAQGQGANGPTVSSACILDLMGLEKSLPNVHILLSIWPALLVAGLALVRGGWLATVVGANVFLPSFVASFGKYLVTFRLRSEQDVLGGLHLDFLPPDPRTTSHLSERIAGVLFAIVAFLVMSAGSWMYAVRNRSQPLQPHVAYLMQAYRPECAAWEVERLVRKTLLALLTVMLPVTLSPALQMESVVLVLTASLVAHLYFWPYQVNSWNRAEVGLLIVALTMMGLTTCLIANDLHWGKSTATQLTLIVLICSMAGGICTIMSIAFLLTYIRDRRNGAHEEQEDK